MTPRARRRWRREVRQIHAAFLAGAAIVTAGAVAVSDRSPGSAILLGFGALGLCRVAAEAGDEIRSWRTDNAAWLVAYDPSSGEPNGIVWRRIGKVVEIRATPPCNQQVDVAPGAVLFSADLIERSMR